jgi:hypothetical protein
LSALKGSLTWADATVTKKSRLKVPRRPFYNPDYLSAECLHRLHACSDDDLRHLAEITDIPLSAVKGFYYARSGLRRDEMIAFRDAIAGLPPLAAIRPSLRSTSSHTTAVTPGGVTPPRVS